MKSPVTNTAPSGAGEDDDDWTEFGESCLCDCREVEVCGDVNSVQQWQWTGHGKEPTFQTCFPTSLPSSSISTKSTLAEDENTKSS